MLAVVGLAAGVALAAGTSGADSTPLSIRIVGNHFVDGSGQTIRLLGVDEPGTEYACYYGYDPGENAADAAAIAAWQANAVRIPLNEDCWLGINNEPAASITQAGYRQAIENYVADLNADGIYAILDLHWSAPGTTVADGQRAMPDDNSASFWESVASTFKDDPAVVFDAFNEPFSPAADGPQYNNYPVNWSCWEDGGCEVPASKDGDSPSGQYIAVGMQALVDAIRGAGAHQPVMLGGLSYANDLSGWLANEPSDTLNPPQLAASFHNYEGEQCSDTSCWTSTVAPVAAKVPVVTGEFDETECDSGTDWDDGFMNWADQNGVSYLAWGWWVLGSSPSCDANYWLISDSSGTPSGPNGTALHAHLAALYAAGQPPPATSSSTTTSTSSSTTTSTSASTTTSTSASTTTSTSGGVPPGIRRLLQSALAALLRADRSPSHARLRFHARAPGRLLVRWTETGRRQVLVASGTLRFRAAGTGTLRVSRTRAGARLLRRRRHVRLRVSVSFAARGGPTVTRTTWVRID